MATIYKATVAVNRNGEISASFNNAENMPITIYLPYSDTDYKVQPAKNGTYTAGQVIDVEELDPRLIALSLVKSNEENKNKGTAEDPEKKLKKAIIFSLIAALVIALAAKFYMKWSWIRVVMTFIITLFISIAISAGIVYKK